MVFFNGPDSEPERCSSASKGRMALRAVSAFSSRRSDARDRAGPSAFSRRRNADCCWLSGKTIRSQYAPTTIAATPANVYKTICMTDLSGCGLRDGLHVLEHVLRDRHARGDDPVRRLGTDAG